MDEDTRIRESLPTDLDSIEALYPKAFPEEELRPLVLALLTQTSGVLSLVATRNDEIIGHVVFTLCRIDGADETAALLGPLAVAPDRQRLGAGSALVKEGLKRLTSDGVARAFVLGDPAYYGRFGFDPEDRITPPYPLPSKWLGAWRSIGLAGDRGDVHGRLHPPAAWLEPNYWGA